MSARLDTLKQRLAALVGLPSGRGVDPAIDMRDRPVVEQLAGWSDELDFKVELQERMSGIGAFQSAPASAVVSLAQSRSGTRAGSIALAIEASLFIQMGIDTVVLGPWHVADLHQSDGYVEIFGVTKKIDIVDGFIRKFCRHE